MLFQGKITEEIRTLARPLWSYHFLQEPLQKSDSLIVLGSHDIRVAYYAISLLQEGWAKRIVFSGALSPFTALIYPKSEAEVFGEIAIQSGVSADQILIENKARNTAENLKLSFELLDVNDSVILVQVPNMLRRVRATVDKLYPQRLATVVSHPLTFSEAPHSYLTEEMLIHEIVGDMQRVLLYPEKGFQVVQDVPENIMNAYQELLRLGFSGNLIS